MPVPAGRRVSDDPLDEVLRPPPDETPEQRSIRLEREAEAKRISMEIDASIKAERQARRKKRIVRLLLLGQSESGKSTTLRQFQRLYTPTAFREERILWRAVIQLNIVRSVRIILEALNSPLSPSNSPFSSPRSRARSVSRPPPMPNQAPPVPNADHYHTNGNGSNPHSPVDQPGPSGYGNSDTSDVDMQFGSPRGHHHGSPQPRHRNAQKFQYAQSSSSTRRHRRSPSNPDSEVDSDTEFYHGSPRSVHNYSNSSVTLANSHLEPLKQKLLPLKHIEQLLIAKLVPPTEDEPTQLAPPGSPYMPHIQQSIQQGEHSSYRNQEIFVRPGPGWKGALSRARVNYPGYSDGTTASANGHHRPTSAGNTGLETQDEPQQVLHMLRKDMVQLWQDPYVKEILRRKKIKLEEGSGFFLDDLERVTSMKYMPSEDDVLKARLKTVGVSEYRFEMEVSAGRDSGTEWRIVDVGGSRSQRPTWVPFFDDVDAIIFLAPISAFDQVLTEDKSVNRLEDSVLLWKAVCSNKLLSNVDLVLFLNKCDILEKKLKDGVRLSKYVRSYGDRESSLDAVSKYLRSKFSAIHREYSPQPRKFYAFCTSVTDTTTTAGIIASVRDTVIRQHLKQSKLL
ncbi:G-alpha-domain-containing protein [Coprinopsis marcescibilis]|uniref:G-alpha-domain-containing protein n=1 Tax=Coprinopsis marcescibilis TaxID=230819 RepID=A0A5C3L769_COPMA|nr:G-alpha-domain-containing protein [Coprinopsis marcescibilis]